MGRPPLFVNGTRKLSAQPLAKAALEGAARDHRKRRNTRFNLRCWQYIYAWFGVKVLNPTVVPKKIISNNYRTNKNI
jgi:hypothetical protein